MKKLTLMVLFLFLPLLSAEAADCRKIAKQMSRAEKMVANFQEDLARRNGRTEDGKLIIFPNSNTTLEGLHIGWSNRLRELQNVYDKECKKG